MIAGNTGFDEVAVTLEKRAIPIDLEGQDPPPPPPVTGALAKGGYFVGHVGAVGVEYMYGARHAQAGQSGPIGTSCQCYDAAGYASSPWSPVSFSPQPSSSQSTM